MKPTSFFSLVFQELRYALLACSFLTRLPVPISATSQDMSRTFCWLPFAGLILGFLSTAPVYAGFFSSYPLLQGWIYTLMLIWLTRAFHLDGLADVLDALGSGKQGEYFFAIMKDSRVGAFGATGLALAIFGQAIIAGYCCMAGMYSALFFSPIAARALPIFFTSLTPRNSGGTLSKAFEKTPNFKGYAISTIFFVGASLASVGIKAAFACVIPLALLIFWLRSIALRNNGYNGDFLGFLVVTSEILCLGTCLAFS